MINYHSSQIYQDNQTCQRGQNNQIYHEQDGTITVFLSLVLILILSLIMTVIEGARQNTARVIAERSLTTSMDSVLAEFYGPLMKEYHLLGLDSSYGQASEASFAKDKIKERMEDYISYTLNPKKDIYGLDKHRELYGIRLDSVEIGQMTSLQDYQGKIFIHEIREYMKYKSIGDMTEFFLDKAKALEQTKKVSSLYEEKVKLEGQLVAIDEGILGLMKYIDGLSTGKQGLLREKNGALKTEEAFVKKILYGSPTMESTGINNELVFKALQNSYVDPSGEINLMSNSFDRLVDLSNKIEDLQGQVSRNQDNRAEEFREMKQMENSLYMLGQESQDNSGDDEGKEEAIESIMASILESKERLLSYDNDINCIQSDITSYEIEQTDCINTITEYVEKIRQLINGSLTASQQAIIQLDHIINSSSEFEPLIKSYEKSIDKEREGLNEDIYVTLKEGLEELKRYQLDNKNGYDFPKMKDKLSVNCNLLRSCIGKIEGGNKALLERDFSKARDLFQGAFQSLSGYDTKGLDINYETLVISEEESSDFLAGISELMKEGVTGLVIDPEIISTKQITTDMLPSVLEALSQEEAGFSFTNLLKSMKVGGKNSGMDGLFSSYGNYTVDSLLGDLADDVVDRILVLNYIKDHYHRFPCNNDEKQGRKPSVLSYEWEYLICGKESDKDNIEKIIGRLILIRTLLNFTSILADKEKWNEAKAIASTLVGFTGLPILVAITQAILMVLLAIASGLVDTCALLIGKSLPILKKKVDLKYIDLLTLSRESIGKKAEAYKDDKGFDYNDYMILFLCLTDQKKLSYRMMDLIQENIQLRYGTEFYIQNCIFGFDVEAVFNIKPLFTSLSFMKKQLNIDINKPFVVQVGCSY